MTGSAMPAAIVLAGGLGTRLRPVTRDICPKPMVAVPSPAGERPFLEWPLAWLRREGVRRVIISVGHLGDQIRAYFGNGGGPALTISFDDAGEADTGARCRSAFRQVQGDMALVVCGDVLADFPLAPFLQELSGHPERDAVLALARTAPDVPPNTAVDADGMVSMFDSGGATGARLGVEAGVLAIRRRALDGADEGASLSLVSHVYPRLIAARSLAASLVAETFFDIGTPAGYARFCDFAATADPTSGLMEDAR